MKIDINMDRPAGDITTLLDLTPRDTQDNTYFPLKAESSWFARDSERRFTPFVPVQQTFQHRGPGEFGQRFTFDIASQTCGDLLLGATLQLQLTNWFDMTTVLNIQTQKYIYSNPQTTWFYANALGVSILESVELEINGVTIEKIDGDFANVFGLLFQDLNTQFGIGNDHFGYVSTQRLQNWPPYRVYPTENGYINCTLPLFFQRTRINEAFPLISCKEGTVRLHITLKQFSDVVRQARGYRDTCTSVPLDTTIDLLDTSYLFEYHVPTKTQIATPILQNVRLLTAGAMIDGKVRTAMLRQPYEIMHRIVQTFSFNEPLKYLVASSTKNDVISIQLPLEANHPIEEIIWYVRRIDTNMNNEWTNYSSVLEKDFNATFNPRQSIMARAKIQINGVDLVDAEEQYFRQLISKHHRGGIVPYHSFIYGYPIAKHPGVHQPSGTMNASRLQNLRLTLDVKQFTPSFSWEVKVFCIGFNWLRFQNGIANTVFID